MFDYINCEWLQPEIMDVIRLFNAEKEHFGHYFDYSNGNYYNSIEYNGEFYDSCNSQFTQDEIEFKRYAKRFAKLAFYNLLSKVKNLKLPYGALTGIRPTKLAYTEREAGRDFIETFATFGVERENIDHVAKILEVQRPYFENRGGQDLFVSLPFCPTKCQYCSFITAPITSTFSYVDAYIDCVERELASIKPLLTNAKCVYVGGGTPFTISENQLERIYAAINALGLVGVEYTVEAGRPDTFTEEKLKLSKDFGVNRICINPQTFKDETLVKIGRRHTSAEVYKAFDMAAKYNFSINLDLIAGLADETLADFENSLKQAINLNPDNITVHTLSLKAGSKLKEECSRLQVEDIGAMIKLSRRLLTEAGYQPYYMYRQKYQAGGWENCGWAKAGKECVYNIDVMEEITDNVAVGANAISKRVDLNGGQIERYASPKDVPTYINKADKIIDARSKLFG